jgi:BirA family transcriptional regulator, biotin operon repressor / biotin---[acetyl-CoA-carboxylase] ligase
MSLADSEALPSASDLGLTRLEHRASLSSTMDVAHEFAAEGVAAGLLVVADNQERGRGRSGNQWASANGAGLWMTLLERPHDASGITVLSLRVGLALAEGLAPFVDGDVRLKWPNDVFVGAGKLAGILVEARWRDGAVEWVAIGVGINMRVPVGVTSASVVRAGVTRNELLMAVVGRVRKAAAKGGELTERELTSWHDRDLARGRMICGPASGRVLGISPDGGLRVSCATHAGETVVRSGSLIFEDVKTP